MNDADPGTDHPNARPISTSRTDGAAEDRDDTARLLFRYIAGDEWRDYRAIMAVFTDTFFAEFSPDDVIVRLAAAGDNHQVDPGVVADRLESLRRWGNLSVSSSVGNPTNLSDYYRRRNRYLITRVGQEVHALVEGVLTRVDEVRDVSTGRLRSLRDALAALADLDLDAVDPGVLADAVRAVFDPHIAFTDEITQFFASINQWQSRYDLSVTEFRFFAEVLVGYVADRLDEIERMALPIGQWLDALQPSVPRIVDRAAQGLASRVRQAGLEGAITVTHTAGSTAEDWELLAAWFVRRGRAVSRIEQLTHDAVSAIRTLTLNLTRLSRVGVGSSSRRADFLRLAQFFDGSDADDAHRIAAAAFGLFPATHYGVLAEDAGDPAPASTSWWQAPRAPVAIAIRERGDSTNRGRTTPMTDRSQSQQLVRRRREQELDARRRVDEELLAVGALHGAVLSAPAMARFQQLLGRTTHRAVTPDGERRCTDGALECVVRRVPGGETVVSSPEGRLTLLTLEVRIEAAPAGALADG